MRPRGWLMKSAVFLLLSLMFTGVALWRRGESLSSLNLIQMSGDGLSVYTLAKGFSQGLEGFTNTHLGAPSGAPFFAAPSLDVIHVATLWLLTKATGNPVWSVNFLFFLGFGLATASSWIVLRHLKVGRPIALLLSFSYGFLPSHWQRQGHVFLLLYWTIPFAILYLVSLGDGRLARWLADGTRGPRSTAVRFALAGGMLLFLVFQGVYYAFFTILLALAVFACELILPRTSPRERWISGLVLGCHLLLFAAVLKVSTWLAIRSGTDLRIFGRSPFEALLYGGELPYLIYPWNGSRFPPLIRLQHALSQAYPGSNENMIWQGIVPAALILAMMSWLLVRVFAARRQAPPREETGSRADTILGVAFVASLALYIKGGLGFVVSNIVPQIRAWNRISYFIAFIAMAWAGMKLTDSWNRQREKSGGRVAVRVVGVLLFLLCSAILVLDELPSGLKLDTSVFQPGHRELADFVGNLENSLPRGCMVLQLPVVGYPEIGPLNGMGDYEEFFPYLLSTGLRFTYGSMKGSDAASWQGLFPKQYDRKALELAAANDFCAVLWDRNGLTPQQQSDLETSGESLGLSPILSKSQRWGALPLGAVKDGLGSREIGELRKMLLEAPIVRFGEGTYQPERDAGGPFIWSRSRLVRITVANPTSQGIDLTFPMTLEASPSGRERTVQVAADGATQSLTISESRPATVSLALTVPARGRREIRLEASGMGDRVATDPRTFYFRIRPLPGFPVLN